MTKCCKCNATGSCVGCVCAKGGTQCVNCVPGAKNRCKNGGLRLSFAPSSVSSQHSTAALASSAPVVESSASALVSSQSGLGSAPAASASSPSPGASASALASGQSGGGSASGASSSTVDTSAGVLTSSFQDGRGLAVPFPSSVPVSGPASDSTGCVIQDIEDAYEIVAHWRRNLFIIPFGAAGIAFVGLLTSYIQAFADGSQLRGVAWKAVSVACHLLLQRPSDSKLLSNHAEHLKRRLSCWESGRIPDLLAEGLCIQQHLPPRARTPMSEGSGTGSVEKNDKTFSNLVFSGRIHSAIRYLTPDAGGGVLSMDDVADERAGTTVRDVLLEKHPAPATPPNDVLLTGDCRAVDPILFERITPEQIRRLARQINGSSGPSGLDADAWRRLLTCFGTASNRLCVALACVGRCLCTENLQPDDLAAFTAARLIPLDKKPGVRPIAVGEVYRRIICKAIMKVVEPDVRRATAPLQMCVGIPSACEAAVHAMERVFEQDDVHGILFVDASNAFNALNRAAALHNMPFVCPSLAQVFRNTYSSPSRLFVSGGGEILSREGTCQGDPLAMALYAAAITPLIHRLEESCPAVTQGWYADDDSAAGKISNLADYWEVLRMLGPGYGYYPNPAKTVLLVKPDRFDEACRVFARTGIRVTTSGSRYLGGAIGTTDFCNEYMQGLSARWTRDLESLACMAVTQPQAAYSVLTKGFTGKWQYHLRACPCPAEYLEPVDDALNAKLLPALLGGSINSDSAQRTLLSLPVRFGGLAVPIVAGTAASEREASIRITQPLVSLLLGGRRDCAMGELPQPAEIDEVVLGAALPPGPIAMADGAGVVPGAVLPPDPVAEAVCAVREAAREHRRSKLVAFRQAQVDIRCDLSPGQRFLIDIAGEKGMSSWLTVSPSYNHGTILNKGDFRDALCLRYDRQLLDIPASCVCGSDLTTAHAFTCPTGGYPTARHNEIRDLVADIIREAGISDVEIEPRLLPCEGEHLAGRTVNRSPEARLDVRARGFWSRQQDAFFDVRITHPAASLLSRSGVLSQLKTHERSKKTQYGPRVTNIQRGSFTPLVFATNGMSGPETTIFLKSLASLLVERNRDLSYPVVMGHLRSRIVFCLLRWCITCFRGCRSSYLRRRPGSFLSQCRENQQ